MLDELVVRNLGVLREARLEPGPGFTVITGETGTGKTILLGALRLLLGKAARMDLIGPFDREATAEGRFLLGDREIAAGRRMAEGGRSRAYLNGAMASAAALDHAIGGLVEIIAQHDQLSLTRTSEVRALIDARLDRRGQEARTSYSQAWERRRRLLEDLQLLGGDRPALERERDLLSHQVDEIERSGFASGDEDVLATQLARLRNAGELREHLERSWEGLEEAREAVGRAVSDMRRAAGLDPSLDDSAALLGGLEAEAGDAAAGIRGLLEEIEADPQALEEAEDRMSRLGDLRRRYGNTLDEVLGYAASARARATELSGLLARADSVTVEIEEAERELSATGLELRAARTRAAAALTEAAVVHLRDLGFSDPHLEVALDRVEPTPTGLDAPTLLFASDSRLKAADISKVASGGELSRLVLALRLAGGAGEAESVVFDEIDAGVGGATALAVGKKIAVLAESRQVLAVTHLPQVAAFADTHYVVTRSEIEASVERIDGQRRIEELSRMLAGLPDSERGREAAEELLLRAASGV